MAAAPETIAAPTGLSWFSQDRLPPLLAAFEAEIEGVRAAEDIEYIHRMRVASRRLRAALPIFRPCFSKKQYLRWMHGISTITRALGEARDADVQIAFLTKYRKRRVAAWKSRHPDTISAEPMEPAIAYLLQDLKENRKAHQEQVNAALAALEKSGVAREMHAVFSAQSAAFRKTPVQALARGIPTMAACRIERRLEAMRTFEPWVMQEDAVAEHHAMRIAAKKLRYTIETFGPVYRLGLHRFHARVKMVQEILGDLHDCDVWIDQVTRLLLKERGLLRTGNQKKRPDTATLKSLRLFLQDREHERRSLHRRFTRYWQSLIRAGVWDQLTGTLKNGRRQRYVPAKKSMDDEILAAGRALAATCPDGLLHQQTVTRLALMIFDCLAPLHQLAGRDRLLLECAGMLHDIGWVADTRRHNVRSARMIFMDESLPLDMIDRIVLGLIAGAHRGRINIESHPLFHLLAPEERTKLLRLAAILRIADGLDCRHAGTVHEIHGVIGSSEVTFSLSATSDVTEEKSRAQSRGDLFVRVFERNLVFP